jgi:hypothetical protein
MVAPRGKLCPDQKSVQTHKALHNCADGKLRVKPLEEAPNSARDERHASPSSDLAMQLTPTIAGLTPQTPSHVPYEENDGLATVEEQESPHDDFLRYLLSSSDSDSLVGNSGDAHRGNDDQ